MPVWLDDIIIVTRGTKEQHTQKLKSVLTKKKTKDTKPVKRSQNSTRKNSVAGVRPNKAKQTPSFNQNQSNHSSEQYSNLQNSYRTYPKKWTT